MKIRIIIILLAIVFGLKAQVNLQENISTNEQWENSIINDALIWRNLLIKHSLANRTQYWNERQQAFNSIITHYPNSNWADDASLMLIGERAVINGDISTAISNLRSLIINYPTQSTIVTGWDYSRGCEISETWLMYAPSLAFANENDSVIARPYNRDGRISIVEHEQLAYFNNLENNPQLTKDVARYIIALMLKQNNDIDGAINELEILLSDYPDLSILRNADYTAYQNQYGYLIGAVPPYDSSPIWRVQYSASVLLINLYIQQNNIEDATKIADKLSAEVTPDGWYWDLNRYLGDFYAKNNKTNKATLEYDRAIQGINNKIVRDTERLPVLYDNGYLIKPKNFISWEDAAQRQQINNIIEINELKNKLNK